MNQLYVQLVITAFGAVLTAVLTWIGKSISSLSKNTAELNTKMGVVIERVNGHEGRLSRVEAHIDSMA